MYNIRFPFLLLLLISVILLLPGLGNTPLWIYDEVRNAQCAREMFERSDWIVPTFNGELRTLKPPLHYFFMFVGFKLFGVTEWGARFFSPIMGIATILITYFFVKKIMSPFHAFITGLILVSSTHFLFQFRMSVPDPYLIFFTAASIFTAFFYFNEKKFYWLLLSAVAFALGTLAKGPVAILLPGCSIFIWLLWENKLRELLSWRILMAIVLVVIIAAPWYWLVHQATNGEWTKGFFLVHNMQRFSSAMEGHGGYFFLVPLFVLIGLLPFSTFIFESLRNVKLVLSNPLLKLSVCVTSVFILFYSLSETKLPNYPIPCYPFLAIIFSNFIVTVLTKNQRTKLYPLLILLILNLIFPVAAYLGIKNESATKGMEYLAFIFCLLSIGALIAGWYWLKGNFKVAFIQLWSVYFLFNLLFFHVAYPKIYRQNSMSKTLALVKKQKQIVAYQIFHPSFTYYLPNRIPVYYSLDSLEQFLSKSNALVISRASFANDLKKINLSELASEHDLFENSTTVLFSNNHQ